MQDTEESFNSNQIDPNFQWREDGQVALLRVPCSSFLVYAPADTCELRGPDRL